MKKVIFIILFAIATVNVWNLNAESEPDPLQEVEASGEGINENDAFKQAVVDAVRQVTGTLVTSETLIQEENVIKEEILSLSNGFVEKVLEQKKIKNPDGTWAVKLKCVVRKGKVYEKLKEVNVPTIKFDGTSLFADVISQVENEKDAAKMLEKALRNYSPMKLITAKMVGDRPEIVERNEKTTKLKIKWEAVWNQEEYSRVVVPPLVDVLEKVKLSDEEASAIKAKDNSGICNLSIWTDEEWKNYKFDRSIWTRISDIPCIYTRDSSRTNLHFLLLLLDKNEKVVHFSLLNPRNVDIDRFYIAPGFLKDKKLKDRKNNRNDRFDLSKSSLNEETVSIPTSLLPEITSIRVLVGNEVNDKGGYPFPNKGSILLVKVKSIQTEGKSCFLKCVDRGNFLGNSNMIPKIDIDTIRLDTKKRRYPLEEIKELYKKSYGNDLESDIEKLDRNQIEKRLMDAITVTVTVVGKEGYILGTTEERLKDILDVGSCTVCLNRTYNGNRVIRIRYDYDHKGININSIILECPTLKEGKKFYYSFEEIKELYQKIYGNELNDDIKGNKQQIEERLMNIGCICYELDKDDNVRISSQYREVKVPLNYGQDRKGEATVGLGYDFNFYYLYPVYEIYDADDVVMEELKEKDFNKRWFCHFFYSPGGYFEFLPWKEK